jgi:uncharacterized protein (DUF2267 family)
MAIDPREVLADDPLRRYDRFVSLVSELASLSRAEAELAARAVLETLGERLDDDQRQQLAARLPKALRPWLQQPGMGEQLQHVAFLHRVAEREGIYFESLDRLALAAAERHTRAVFEVLQLVIEPDDVDAIAARLPEDVRKLLRPRGHQPRPVVIAEELVERVAELTRFDHERALGAVEAVMEALGERLAAGEVKDLERLLPGEFRPALELGAMLSRGKATRMSLDEFLSRVSEQDAATFEESLDLARAVFAALREALPQRELDDILAELPQEYDELLGRRSS